MKYYINKTSPGLRTSKTYRLMSSYTEDVPKHDGVSATFQIAASCEST
jgi:hypothetical protein